MNLMVVDRFNERAGVDVPHVAPKSGHELGIGVAATAILARSVSS